MPDDTEWANQYANLKNAFEIRADRSKRLAHLVLAVICSLLGGAAIVFLLPQHFSATGSADLGAIYEDITRKKEQLVAELNGKLAPLQRNNEKLLQITSMVSRPEYSD